MNKVTKGEGVGPLYIASYNGHLSVVQYLVQQGADKDMTTSKGSTPLIFAAQDGHLSVVQ